MAPVKSVKKTATDKRLQQVLDCARKACTLLKDRATIPGSFEAELDAIIKRSFPFPPSTALAGKASALDGLGSQLWNAATNILREEENERDPSVKRKERTRLIVLLRVFGYSLVDAAQHTSTRRTKDHDQRVRTFKIALKACRFSLDHGEAELAMKILERCSEYASDAEEGLPIVRISGAVHGDSPNDQVALKQLVVEYYLLRMTYAWKTERFDVADHFFAKLNLRELPSSAVLAEKAADLFHQAATSLASKKLWDLTSRWCERAVSALDSCETEDLSHDAPELRLAITATLVEALLTSGTAESWHRASRLVDQLETAYGMGNRIAVSLMRFQVLTAGQQVDAARVEDVMARMIRQAVLTDKSFKTILQTVHKLRRVSLHSALVALEDLINVRLLPDILPDEAVDSPCFDRLEKAMVMYVLFVTSQDELQPQDAAAGIRSVLDEVSRHTQRIFTAKATHAAQTLIWKRAGALRGGVVDDWCRLLRHPVFENAGQMNKAKIARKAIAAAVARGSTDAAREAFFEMLEAAQNESITRYLVFKVALCDEDQQLATECLAMVTKHADKDPTYLYACVLEAQQSNMRHAAVAALQALSEKQPPGVHLPSLLRCTAQLLIGELEASLEDIDRMAEDVVVLFERAAKNITTLKQGTEAQWRSEVQWWSKNAYNLALRLCAVMHPEYLVRLLDVSIRFLDCYPRDDEPMHQDNVRQRGMLCHFLSASALIVLGRSSEEGSDYSLKCYLQARGHITAFINNCTEWESAYRHDAAAKEQRHDMLARKFELLKFDLECILKLQKWEQLDKAVQSFLSFEGADRWDSLADLVIVIHDHARIEGASSSATARIPRLLQKCINETWKKDKDVRKMGRWLRLTFTISMDDGDPDFALKIVEQASSVAQKGYNGQADVYPLDELSWLATTAFNKAVDSLNTGDTNAATPWTTAGLELARYADDYGTLHANLTHRKEAAEARMRRRGAHADAQG